MSHLHTHFMCPVCGRSVGVKGYDPEGRPLDVFGKSFSGLGRGMGFEVSDEESILHTNPDDPVLLKIRDRVAEVYDMFFEDDSVEELIDRINGTLGTSYETLMEASEDAFSRLQDFMEEELDEDETNQQVWHSQETLQTQEIDDEEDWGDEEPEITEEPISELDREILIGEYEQP